MILGFPRAKQGLCHTKHGGAGGIILWALLTVFLVSFCKSSSFPFRSWIGKEIQYKSVSNHETHPKIGAKHKEIINNETLHFFMFLKIISASLNDFLLSFCYTKFKGCSVIFRNVIFLPSSKSTTLSSAIMNALTYYLAIATME